MPTKEHSKMHFPAALRPHNIKLKTFCKRNKQYTDLAVAYDLHEVPWAVSALTDRMILYSVRRVVFERTGLHFKRFVKQIGNREDYKSSEGLCARLNFEIEVLEEVDELNARPPVKVNKDTHQDFVWVKEEDIKNDAFPLAMPEQKDVILQAFQLRRETEEAAKTRAAKAERKRKKRLRRIQQGINWRYLDEVDSVEDDDEEEDGEDDEEKDEEAQEEKVLDEDEGIHTSTLSSGKHLRKKRKIK